MKKLIQFIRSYFALLAIAVAFALASVSIYFHRKEQAPEGAIVLRLGHWQLEGSVRDALNAMAERYRKEVNPNVFIVQDAIPEMVYGQWLTTQLMGGTAPDMLEMGIGVPYHLLVQYYNRYFVPLTPYVDRPNPHNRDSSLASTPLRSTFKDGMRNSYIEELQEYMNIPLSQFGVRVFFNSDLLKQLTGRTAIHGYRDFLAACEEIEAHRNEKGKPYIAIAGSKYHLPMWESMMFDPLTYPVLSIADFNRDGFVSNDEVYTAFKAGRLSFDHPAIRARYKMLRDVSSHFQTGYTGLTRDEAVFLFAQQRAVFITTGTWDVRSLQQQAKGQFEVGVMDFPVPDKDDPEYGEVVLGKIYEKPVGGFPFGITRFCKHPEVALDFLLFMASQKGNEDLNRIIGWIPTIVDTKMDPVLEAFQPHLRGVYGCLNLFLGGETWVKWLQLYSLYQIQQISYEDLAAEFQPYYIKNGLKDFVEQQKDWRRGMQSNELFLTGFRSKALFGPLATKEASWVKYRLVTDARQVSPEIGHQFQMAQVLGTLPLAESGPYEYGDDVIARIRARLGETK